MNIVQTNGKPVTLTRPPVGGPVVKVSNSTVIRQLDGSVTLLVTPGIGGSALSPSPNVSVSSTSGKRAGARATSSKKTDTNSTTKGSKESKEVTLKGDLRNIMHAFGDGSSPSEDSVQLMEVILRHEMSAFLFLCDTASYWSGSKVVGLRECIYVLRNEKTFLSRLFKFLIAKDQQQRISRVNHVGQKTTLLTTNYLSEIRGILKDLDETRELESLLDLENNLDSSKPDKAHLGDVNNHRLNSPKYINYAKARSVSFARKLPQLPEWVSRHLHTEYKLSQSFMDVLAFLLFDFVAQLVDLSFIIKRERMGTSNPLLKTFDPRGSNPDTCMSASIFLRKDEECNNVSEILVLASELEAKRLKKVTSSNREVMTAKSVQCLSPSEIKEAYNRMQNSYPPSASFRSRAEKIRKYNFQY